MSKVNAKNYIKDTNYSDFVQKEIGFELQPQKTDSLNSSFVQQPNTNQKLHFRNVSSRQNANVGGKLENIQLTSIPGSFGSFQQFQNYIQNKLSTGPLLNHLLVYETTTNIALEDKADYFHSFESKYNFFSIDYQNSYFNGSERLIPNYYVEKSDLNDFKSTSRPVSPRTFVKNEFRINSRADAKMRNIIINDPKDVAAELKNYPLYIKMKFYNNTNDVFKKEINKLGLFDNLIQDYIDNSNVSFSNFQLNAVGDNSSIVDLKNYKIFSLLDWVQNQNYNINESNKTFLNTLNKSSHYTFRLSKNILNGVISRISNDKLRSYSDVLNNKPCYSEVLFYKIDKYVGNIIGEPVQTFWVSSPQAAISLVDTQIKEGQIYSYDVKAVLLVVGNTYRFRQPTYEERFKQYYSDIQVSNNPSIQLVEVPYFTERFLALQDPPMSPDIRLFTKKNSDNFIYISLNKQIGSIAKNYTPIEPIDSSQLEKMDLVLSNNAFKDNYFKSSLEEEYFEVYRLNNPPLSYGDFADNKIMNIKGYLEHTKQNPSKVTLKDKVQPNRKYYYMFRAVNVNQSKSNPSEVFEVELIKDADESKIIVSKYDFPKPNQYDNYKKFSSLFQIRPRFEQTFFDNQQYSIFNSDTAIGKLDQIKLGTADDSLWGKTFKIRVKSKSTGKMIDFNVNFDLNLIKNDKL